MNDVFACACSSFVYTRVFVCVRVHLFRRSYVMKLPGNSKQIFKRKITPKTLRTVIYKMFGPNFSLIGSTSCVTSLAV